MVSPLGRHLVAELSDCQPELLGNLEQVREAVVQAALAAGAEVREVAFHPFRPGGVSGVVVIAESHLSIHTWPELRYAALDVFTCGEHTDPWKACRHLAGFFEAGRMAVTVIERGIPGPRGSFGQVVVSEERTLSLETR